MHMSSHPSIVPNTFRLACLGIMSGPPARYAGQHIVLGHIYHAVWMLSNLAIVSLLSLDLSQRYISLPLEVVTKSEALQSMGWVLHFVNCRMPFLVDQFSPSPAKALLHHLKGYGW